MFAINKTISKIIYSGALVGIIQVDGEYYFAAKTAHINSIKHFTREVKLEDAISRALSALECYDGEDCLEDMIGLRALKLELEKKGLKCGPTKQMLTSQSTMAS